jgi:hypothetical protein
MRLRLIAAVLILAPCLMLLDALAVVPDANVPPVGDYAGTELYVRLAMQGQQRLGPYSHLYVSHPGPVYFYAAVPLYRLTGESFRGITATALLINLLSIVGILILAGRGGTGAMLAATIGLELFLHERGPEWLYSIWCPNVVVLPFGFAVFACAAFALGDDVILIPAGIAASLAGQTHMGTLPVLGVVFITAVACRLTPVRRLLAFEPLSPARPRWGILAIAVLVVIILWTPTFVEQFSAGGGNLGKIMTLTRPPNDQPAAHLVAIVVANAFGLVTRRGAILTSLTVLPVGLVLAALLLARRRQALAVVLALLTLVGLGAAAFVASRITGSIGVYLIRWVVMLGLAGLTAIGGAAAVRVRLSDRGRRSAASAAIVLAMALAAWNAQAAWAARAWQSAPPRPKPESVAAGRLADLIASSLTRAHIARPRIEVIEDGNSDIMLGLLLALDKRGISFGVKPFGAFRLEGPWSPRGTEDATILIGGDRLPAGATLLGSAMDQFVYLRRF